MTMLILDFYATICNYRHCFTDSGLNIGLYSKVVDHFQNKRKHLFTRQGSEDDSYLEGTFWVQLL